MDSIIPQRNFGGKLADFTDNRERHFNQRMLKAYLRGASRFAFGFEDVVNLITGKRDHLYHDVITIGKAVDQAALESLFQGGSTKSGSVFNKNGRQSKKEIKAMIKVRLSLKKK